MWAELCFSQSHCVLLFLNASHLSCLGSAQSRLKQLFHVPLLSLDLLHLSSVPARQL